MYIDVEKKFIFFHNGKCGGSTITALLNDYCIKKYGQNSTHRMAEFFNDKNLHHIPLEDYGIAMQHMTYSRLVDIFPDHNWDQYMKFCFVRNPYTHLYSIWLQWYQNFHPDPEHYLFIILAKANGDFNKFAHIMEEENWIWTFQHNEIYTLHNNKTAMNFIGRFENFTHDLQEICRIVDIPYIPLHENKRGDNNYLQYYTADSIRLVNKYAARSFELFNYEMLDPNDFPETFESEETKLTTQHQYIATEKLTKTQEKILQVFHIYKKRNSISNKSNMIQLLNRVQTHYPTWNLIQEIQVFLDNIEK